MKANSLFHGPDWRCPRCHVLHAANAACAKGATLADALAAVTVARGRCACTWWTVTAATLALDELDRFCGACHWPIVADEPKAA